MLEWIGKLKPLIVLQEKSGLRKRLTGECPAKLKKAICKTPKSSTPTILALTIEKKRTT